jgi:hypothetical protein
MARFWILVVAGFLFSAGCAHAAVKLERLPADDAPIEQRIASGQGVFWTLERREISHRGQTWLDGVIVVAPESGLKLRPIRRASGDQEVVLGREGKEGTPIAELTSRVKDMSREKMVPYRLDMGDEIAAIYAPFGAIVRASQRKTGVLIEIEIPEDKRRERWKDESGISVGIHI